MKIKSPFEKKSTKLYNNFQTHEEAGYNIPYVAATLNKSIVSGEFFNFTLGKHALNELSKVANSSIFSKFLDPFFSYLVILQVNGRNWLKCVSLLNKLK